MNTSTTALQRDAVTPLTHIFLSLVLLEAGVMNEENESYINIISQNAER